MDRYVVDVHQKILNTTLDFAPEGPTYDPIYDITWFVKYEALDGMKKAEQRLAAFLPGAVEPSLMSLAFPSMGVVVVDTELKRLLAVCVFPTCNEEGRSVVVAFHGYVGAPFFTGGFVTEYNNDGTVTREEIEYWSGDDEGVLVTLPLNPPLTSLLEGVPCELALAQLREVSWVSGTKGYVATRNRANAKRTAKGKKPLYDWRTVVIELKAPKQESKGGTHASPRPHDRRGHYRTYKSGKQVWVRNMRVGEGDGFVFKDYIVKQNTNVLGSL